MWVYLVARDGVCAELRLIREGWVDGYRSVGRLNIAQGLEVKALVVVEFVEKGRMKISCLLGLEKLRRLLDYIILNV
jgi:hypothetical protein